jgi:hypothetical protein
MLRRPSPGWLLLGIALLLLNGACTSTDAFPPTGTAVLKIRVNNASAETALLVVVPGRGAPVSGSVDPPALAPKTAADVTFYVPIAATWTIRVNGEELIDSSEVGARRGVLDNVGIDIDVRGNPVWWCKPTCP